MKNWAFFLRLRILTFFFFFLKKGQNSETKDRVLGEKPEVWVYSQKSEFFPEKNEINQNFYLKEFRILKNSLRSNGGFNHLPYHSILLHCFFTVSNVVVHF